MEGTRWLSAYARSTLADANRDRPHQIWGEMFYALYEHCQNLVPGHKFKIKMPVFTLDSTTISLCLSQFPWARYRKRKGAIKLHTLLDHDGCLPCYVSMSDGKRHDVTFAKNEEFGLPDLPPDSILTMDRGYIDFKWLYSLHLKGTTFIVRSKSNMNYDDLGQHKEPNEKRGIVSDQVIEMSNEYKYEEYPESLRMIRLVDKKSGKSIDVVTNNFKLSAGKIAELYKGRWEIEEFFKWIKQHLKIKTFIGTSENAVYTQVWSAMISYLLLSFIKFQSKYTYSVLELKRVLKEILWEHKSLLEILRVNFDDMMRMRIKPIQESFY
jgi:Transposase DDE domain